ncbi:hypothetical protein [Streptomyces sp. NPDC055506]
MLTLMTGRQVRVAVVCERAGDPLVGSIDLAEANVMLLVRVALLLNAIKSTAKGGIGKLRLRSRGQVPYYEP